MRATVYQAFAYQGSWCAGDRKNEKERKKSNIEKGQTLERRGQTTLRIPRVNTKYSWKQSRQKTCNSGSGDSFCGSENYLQRVCDQIKWSRWHMLINNNWKWGKMCRWYCKKKRYFDILYSCAWFGFSFDVMSMASHRIFQREISESSLVKLQTSTYVC